MGLAKSKSITDQNTFTDAVRITDHGTVRISGTWAATVTLQRSDDEGSTWVDTGDTWTANGVYSFTDYTDQLYRAGVKTGGFTSGTIALWIGSN